MVIPQQFNFVNQQQQLKQFQQFQQYQQAQLRQQQQQQQQQQMAERVQNPQFVFRQVPGGPASPQMPSPLSTTAQKPGQMFTSSPAASTSFQSTSWPQLLQLFLPAKAIFEIRSLLDQGSDVLSQPAHRYHRLLPQLSTRPPLVPLRKGHISMPTFIFLIPICRQQ